MHRDTQKWKNENGSHRVFYLDAIFLFSSGFYRVWPGDLWHCRPTSYPLGHSNKGLACQKNQWYDNDLDSVAKKWQVGLENHLSKQSWVRNSLKIMGKIPYVKHLFDTFFGVQVGPIWPPKSLVGVHQTWTLPPSKKRGGYIKYIWSTSWKKVQQKVYYSKNICSVGISKESCNIKKYLTYYDIEKAVSILSKIFEIFFPHPRFYLYI